MADLLEQLREMTVVVADTGEIDAIRTYEPQDATTNPSLLLKAAQMEAYDDIVTSALERAAEEAGDDADDAEIASLAIDRLYVAFGLEILDIIPGRVSTEVDARLSFETGETVEKARHLIELYEEAGVDRERILIKIASTWEGVRAAEILESEGIHCNMTLMFGLHQAVACAEADVTLISPFVGRIYDWYRRETGRDTYPPEEDPGVQSVTEIFNYYKHFGYDTEIMGASFRHLGQITELAGCDLLTIAPKFLEELRETEGDLERKLDPEAAAALELERIEIDEETFGRMHREDRMAYEKLEEGIRRFSEDSIELEKYLVARLESS
jgi:transaldolase